MSGDFRPVAPVDPTNLRPMLFLDVARQMMLDDGWPHRAVSAGPVQLLRREQLERMMRESPWTPEDVPLHPAAAAVWQAHGYLP